MANYYNFIIKSDKITQEVASDIFTQASAHNKITHFEFSEGHIFMYSRGVPDIADVLEKYNITDDERYRYRGVRKSSVRILPTRNRATSR